MEQTRAMKTMDCSTLGMLIENHEPVDLIDIRSKKEFSSMHIPGARSLPFRELAVSKGFRRYRRIQESVYIVGDDQGKASLAAGILRACGYMNAAVLDGGMKAWLDQGLPIRCAGFSRKVPTSLRAIAVILAVAGIAFAFSQPWAAIGALIIGALFILQAQLVEKTGQPGRKEMIPGNEQPVAC